jgi:hypothetical protein
MSRRSPRDRIGRISQEWLEGRMLAIAGRGPGRWDPLRRWVHMGYNFEREAMAREGRLPQLELFGRSSVAPTDEARKDLSPRDSGAIAEQRHVMQNALTEQTETA